MGMCRWMESHFHDWIDYNGVAFSIELTRMGSHVFGIFGVRKFWQERILRINKIRIFAVKEKKCYHI